MKFLCDEMLKGVARWLRAAGYDTTMEADGTADSVLLEKAHREHRILLTRDQRLAEQRPDGGSMVLLQCNGQHTCLEELRERLGVDWLYRPFTRCLKCNTRLQEAPAERWVEIPEQSRDRATRLLLCPQCDQLFWDGDHVTRMRARLAAANRVPVKS